MILFINEELFESSFQKFWREGGKGGGAFGPLWGKRLRKPTFNMVIKIWEVDKQQTFLIYQSLQCTIRHT